MDHLLEPIKQLAWTTDDVARRGIIDSLHQLANSLETVEDTTYRISHLNLEIATTKIGFDLRIFRYLSGTQGRLTLASLAEKTGADAKLLSTKAFLVQIVLCFTTDQAPGRILVHLAAVGAVDETAKDEYTANNISKNLSSPLAEGAIQHFFDTCGPQYQALPALLKNTGYMNPDNDKHTAFNEAFNTSADPFSWFADHPENLGYFNKYMACRRESEHSWLSVYPVLEHTRTLDSDSAVFVNVGGSIGHQCAEFKGRYPSIPGRVILQDLPHTIVNALSTPGVENMAHDFYEPQPIKGARFFFARAVLHDHPDSVALRILGNIKSAMSHDSILLLDEMLLPETRVNKYVASIDLTMMASRASRERTESEWRDLIAESGLKLVKVYTYNPSSYESVLDVRLP